MGDRPMNRVLLECWAPTTRQSRSPTPTGMVCCTKRLARMHARPRLVAYGGNWARPKDMHGRFMHIVVREAKSTHECHRTPMASCRRNRKSFTSPEYGGKGRGGRTCGHCWLSHRALLLHSALSFSGCSAHRPIGRGVVVLRPRPLAQRPNLNTYDAQLHIVWYCFLQRRSHRGHVSLLSILRNGVHAVLHA